MADFQLPENMSKYCLLTLCLLLGISGRSAGQQVETQTEWIFKNTFDQYPKSKQYSLIDFELDWKKPLWENGVKEGRAHIVSGSKAYNGSGACLAVVYPVNKIGSSESGVQWKYYFYKGYEEAELTYRVKFPEGFDFVRGGKLPGFASGTAPTGRKQADGENGWSARLMWRENGAAIAYTQHVHSGENRDGREEDRDYWKGFRFQTGRWYLIGQQIKLNDSEQKNGVLQIRVDGKVMISRNDIQFRKTKDLLIDQLYFSTFFGGAESSWEPKKQETIYFDDFRIIGNKKGSVKLSNKPNAPRD